MSLETVPINIEGGRCWVNPRVASAMSLGGCGPELAAFCRAIWLKRETGELFKSDRKTRVQRVKHGEKPWVVKTYFTGRIKQRIYTPFKLTPAWREWRGAARLLVAGVRCNPPLALLDGALVGAGAQALVLPWVEGLTIARLITMATPPNRRSERARRFDRAQARSLGTQVGDLFRLGIRNRDGKVSNLVVDDDCKRSGGMLPPVIIDPSAIRRWRTQSQLDQALAIMWADARLVGRVPLREAVEFSRAMLRALGENDGTGCVRRLRARVEPWVIHIEGKQGSFPPPRPLVEPHPADSP